LPVLGPAVEAAALPGPRGAAHVLLRHASGAVSTLTLGLDAPPAAVTHELAFFGQGGWVVPPDRELGPVEAYGVALDALLRNAREGREDPRDVRFGREVVAVLEAAAVSLREGRTVAVAGRSRVGAGG
jgi:predicted dehydrogenase